MTKRKSVSQSVHALGGWRVQGRDADGANALRTHARELADAGAAMLVLELTPSPLARALAEELPIPVIGIVAGAGCGGQVLVLHDMLGLAPRPARSCATSSTAPPRSMIPCAAACAP